MEGSLLISCKQTVADSPSRGAYIITWTLKGGRRWQEGETWQKTWERFRAWERDHTQVYWLWRWRRLWSRECRWLLEAGEGPHLIASKQTGTQNHKALTLANNLSELGSGFIATAFWKEGSWHLLSSSGDLKPRAPVEPWCFWTLNPQNCETISVVIN